MTPRPGLRLMLIVAMLATIASDRLTKHLAAQHLVGTPTRSYLADTCRLEYAENEGAFLGIGADWPPRLRMIVFSVGNGMLLVALAILTMRLHWPTTALFGLAFCVAGGLSNLLDRVAYGKVIDFMNVGIGPVRTGIFNVADMAITGGVLLVLLVASAERPTDRGSSGLPS